MVVTVCLFLLRPAVPASPLPAAVEEQARAVLDKLTAAGKAKDVKAVSALLSKDCIIIMTEPCFGFAARVFLHEIVI
jgi:hypothetical protein